MQNTQDQFHLPPDISFKKERLSYGWAYVFRHAQLGELGRIVLQGRPDGRTQLICEVVGDPADPMTEKRAAIFKPLGMELAQKFDKAIGGEGKGKGPWVDPPLRPTDPQKGVASKLMQCETCGAGVALLIFADHATDLGGLEDYARLMYPKVAELNVPTWVIGPPVGNGPPDERPADILKIWPEREPVSQLRPDEFNPIMGIFAQRLGKD